MFYMTDVFVFCVTDVLVFCVTDVLLKCHGSLPGHNDIGMSWSVLQMSWCSMLQMCYWSAMAPCQVTLTMPCPDVLCFIWQMSWCSVLQMSWCSVLQMCYWSAMAPCQVTLTLSCPDVLCDMCCCSVLQMCNWSAMAPCQATLTLSCPDVLCYRCVTEVPWFPARSNWHCHVLMFCVTDVLLKCHGSLPGHTDIVMSCAFSPSGDILASGYVWFCLYEIFVMSFFFSSLKHTVKLLQSNIFV